MYPNSETAFVLQCCKAILSSGKEPFDVPVSAVSVSSIAGLIRRNGLAPLFHTYENLLSAYLPDALKGAFKADFVRTFIVNTQRVGLFRQIADQLSTRNMTVIPLKGLHLILKTYPHPALRPMGDIDIYIDNEHIEKASVFLLSNGFSIYTKVYPSAFHLRMVRKYHHHLPALIHQKTGIVTELHRRVSENEGIAPTSPQRDLTLLAQPDPENPGIAYLSQEATLRNLCAHFLENFRQGGIRLGWLFDIVYTLRQLHASDSVIQALCRETMSGAVFEFLNRHFLPQNEQLPTECDEETYRIVEERLFELTAQGDQSKKDSTAYKKMLRNIPLPLEKFQYLINDLFPSRSYMQHRYKLTHKWQLPRFYLQRLIRAFRRIIR